MSSSLSSENRPRVIHPQPGTAEYNMYQKFREILIYGHGNQQDGPADEKILVQARKDLISFTELTYSSYVTEMAHRLIARKLTQVLNGEIRRLMIFAPPQHGKSELVSVRFPAFWFGHRPDDPIIFTSYGAQHAKSKARNTRELIDSAWYQRLFPNVRVSKKTRGQSSWKIADHRGAYEAIGMGGPITGFGTMLGIIDDPVKNWKEAQSETARNRHYDWYRSTFRTRVWEGGSIVIIMTRWHEDDLAGRLLKAGKEDWHVLRLPAIAETPEERLKNNKLLQLPGQQDKDPLGRNPGQALCPKRFSLNELLQLKEDVGSMAWYAEYQGTPRAPEGNWLKRVWYTITHMPPQTNEALFVRYWDKAGTSGSGKYTSGVLMSYEKMWKRYTVLDVVRGRWTALKREQIIKQTAINDRKNFGYRVQTWLEQEPGSGGKDQALTTVANLRGFDVHIDKVNLAKEVRLNPGAYGFQAQSEARFIYVLQGPWNEDWFDEITTVPNSIYWDQIDATVGAFNKLNSMSNTWEAVSNLGRIPNFTTPWD